MGRNTRLSSHQQITNEYYPNPEEMNVYSKPNRQMNTSIDFTSNHARRNSMLLPANTMEDPIMKRSSSIEAGNSRAESKQRLQGLGGKIAQ